MDQKAFTEFQTAVQWVVDERRLVQAAQAEGMMHLPALRHDQRVWAAGEIIPGEIITACGEHGWQEDYRPVCASSCCLAGNIVQAHGDRFVTPAHGDAHYASVEQCVDDDGTLYQIRERAQELAGLTGIEAKVLFHQDNSPDQIVHLAKNIAYGHGYTLEII